VLCPMRPSISEDDLSALRFSLALSLYQLHPGGRSDAQHARINPICSLHALTSPAILTGPFSTPTRHFGYTAFRSVTQTCTADTRVLSYISYFPYTCNVLRDCCRVSRLDCIITPTIGQHMLILYIYKTICLGLRILVMIKTRESI